jgi:prephenate dehydrogenase
VFQHIAILGTGLIGGSFALAARRGLPQAQVVGWDKPDVLARAVERGAIHRAAGDLSEALVGAGLVYIALPVGLALELLPRVAQQAAPEALVTDACSTKAAVCRAARAHFSGAARFLGGHPLAGKASRGIEHADAELFRGAKYALMADREDADARVRAFAALVEVMGAQPAWLDAETHDWAAAIISHVPQLLAVALAGVVRDETDETGLPLTLAGGGLRDMLRLAGSPYETWRDICLTNTDNIARGLDRLAQAVDHLRMSLASRELRDDFAAANELYKILQDLK